MIGPYRVEPSLRAPNFGQVKENHVGISSSDIFLKLFLTSRLRVLWGEIKDREQSEDREVVC
jgi:hypothetical protein